MVEITVNKSAEAGHSDWLQGASRSPNLAFGFDFWPCPTFSQSPAEGSDCLSSPRLLFFIPVLVQRLLTLFCTRSKSFFSAHSLYDSLLLPLVVLLTTVTFIP
jgi:hypothetical protein